MMKLIDEAKKIARERRLEEPQEKQAEELKLAQEKNNFDELFNVAVPALINDFIGVFLEDGRITMTTIYPQEKFGYIWVQGRNHRQVICGFGKLNEEEDCMISFFSNTGDGGTIRIFDKTKESYAFGNTLKTYRLKTVLDLNRNLLPKLATILSRYF